MNTLSRLQAIRPPEPDGVRRARVVRVVVTEDRGIDQPAVVLSPGDRLIVENRTGRTLHVAPLDFFGTAFGRHGEGHLRMSYATSVENIRDALEGAEATLAEFPGR